MYPIFLSLYLSLLSPAITVNTQFSSCMFFLHIDLLLMTDRRRPPPKLGSVEFLTPDWVWELAEITDHCSEASARLGCNLL